MKCYETFQRVLNLFFMLQPFLGCGCLEDGIEASDKQFYKVKLPLKIRNIKLAEISCDLLHACMTRQTHHFCPHNVNTIVTTSISEFTSSLIWIFRQSFAKRKVGFYNNNNNNNNYSKWATQSNWKMLTWERETGKGASCTNCTNCTNCGRTLNTYPNLKKPYISISLRMQGLLFADEDECTAYYFSMYIACHKGNCDPIFLQCQKKN